MKVTYLAKNSIHTKLKLNAQIKRLCKILTVIMRKILPFEKALYLTKIDRKVEDDTITQQNQVIKTKTKMLNFTKMLDTSFTTQNEVPVTSNSKLVPLINIVTLEHVDPVLRKLFTKSIPNVPLAGRLGSLLNSSLGKIMQDQ